MLQGCVTDAETLPQKNGFDDIHYVWGVFKDVQHGWLHADGFIVDITADQFEGEDRPVIVAGVDEGSFHARVHNTKEIPCKPQRPHIEKADFIITEYRAHDPSKKDEHSKANTNAEKSYNKSLTSRTP